MVMMLIPNAQGHREAHVGLVLSCWVTMRKPKLATLATKLEHLVCTRVVEMTEITEDTEGSVTYYKCFGTSRTWVVLPESIVAILAPVTIKNELHSCSVTLSEESTRLLHTESLCLYCNVLSCTVNSCNTSMLQYI